MKKTIGIIGGMGPMATVDLMKKVILATDAREDQEHIPILSTTIRISPIARRPSSAREKILCRSF